MNEPQDNADGVNGSGGSIATDLAVVAENLSLTLSSEGGPVEILRGISMSIVAGDTVSLVGSSGSGKTSLLMVLSGLERMTSGSATVNNVNIADLDEDRLASFRRQRIGIVFQAFHLISTMTALENVAIPLELAGIANAQQKAREALQSVNMDHRLKHFPWQLSGGEQQRVAIARAFVPRPRLLFADEPTGNLDKASGDRVADLLFSMTQDHQSTLILVTHDQSLAARCRTRLRMDGGRIVDETTPV